MFVQSLAAGMRNTAGMSHALAVFRHRADHVLARQQRLAAGMDNALPTLVLLVHRTYLYDI